MITLKRLNVVKIVDSEHKAQAWERKGFKRVVEPEVVELQVEPKPLDKMTVPELEAYAVEKGIDLSECKNKEEKLERIMSVEGGE